MPKWSLRISIVSIVSDNLPLKVAIPGKHLNYTLIRRTVVRFIWNNIRTLE